MAAIRHRLVLTSRWTTGVRRLALSSFLAIGVIIAIEFAQGNLIWAEAFSDRWLWRFLLAAQPVFAIGVSVGAFATALVHRRIDGAILTTAVVIWISNALSVAELGVVAFLGGGT